jgi:hypothetical protein
MASSSMKCPQQLSESSSGMVCERTAQFDSGGCWTSIRGRCRFASGDGSGGDEGVRWARCERGEVGRVIAAGAGKDPDGVEADEDGLYGDSVCLFQPF